MNDLENLTKIKTQVLETLDDKFPEVVNKTIKDGNLCYFIRNEDNTIYSVIDFTKTMPETMQDYQMMIQYSANEWLDYDIGNNYEN